MTPVALVVHVRYTEVSVALLADRPVGCAKRVEVEVPVIVGSTFAAHNVDKLHRKFPGSLFHGELFPRCQAEDKAEIEALIQILSEGSIQAGVATVAIMPGTIDADLAKMRQAIVLQIS